MSLYSHYLARAELVTVQENSLNVLRPGSKEQAIGIHGLNGSNCIVMMGNDAVMLAEIGPFPGTPTKPEEIDIRATDDAYQHHYLSQMNNISVMASSNPDLFPPATTVVWGIFSLQPDGALMPIASHIKKHIVDTMGVGGWRQGFYRIVDVTPTTSLEQPLGELVAVRRLHAMCLYLDRCQISRKPHKSQSDDSTAKSPSANDSEMPKSYWAWSIARERWGFIVDGQQQNVAPPVHGKERVFCVEEKRWRMWDFDTMAWIEE